MIKIKSERNEFGMVYYAEIDRVHDTYKTFQEEEDLDGYERVSGYLAMSVVNMAVNSGYRRIWP